MSKTLKPAADETSRLVMSLTAPGMSPLHRAGLGGLACTLRWIEREAKAGRSKPKELPGGTWHEGQAPWRIDPLSIVLEFGEPNAAGDFLKRLFVIAFQVDRHDGLMFLPGQYLETPPSVEVRAYLQQGNTLTFLQHGKSRTLAKIEAVKQYESDDKQIAVTFRPCSEYKHQGGWRNLVDRFGRVATQPAEVVGPLNPGAVVRHVAYSARTKIEDPPDRLLPLYFAIVGCLALPINRGSGVLVVPDVQDLEQFCRVRPQMTPTSARECQISSAGDAALQAQVRIRNASKRTRFTTSPKPHVATTASVELKAKEIANFADLPGCHASLFQPTPWASQQKSRVQTLIVPAGVEGRLEAFAAAMAALPPRVVTRIVKERLGRGKKKLATQHDENFWIDSVVRPLVADNLARGRPWYHDFVGLMTRTDPVSKRPFRDRLSFERKGLKTMTELLQQPGESAVVRAVHEAIRCRYGKIADENKNNRVAREKRWQGEYDRWRLAFAASKTPDQFRKSLCDLFSRAGGNKVLQAEWKAVVPMLDERKWQLTRDLALLGLASYTSSGAKEAAESETNKSDE